MATQQALMGYQTSSPKKKAKQSLRWRLAHWEDYLKRLVIFIDHHLTVWMEAHRHQIIATGVWLDTWLHPIKQAVMRLYSFKRTRILSYLLVLIGVLLFFAVSLFPMVAVIQEEGIVRYIGCFASLVMANASIPILAICIHKEPCTVVVFSWFDMELEVDDSIFFENESRRISTALYEVAIEVGKSADNVLCGAANRIGATCDDEREIIENTVSMLSLGKISVEIPEIPKAGKTTSHDDFTAACADVIESIQHGGRVADDLVTLWEGALGGLRIDNWQKDPEALSRLANIIGIEDMIDTYLAGVPAEDIVA